jgi:alanyl-tRNA synthetase
VRVTHGGFEKGMIVRAEVDVDRRSGAMRHHTATHLLNAALRETLGPHVKQAGSLVAPDRLRFDFAHPKALTPEEIAAIEAEVNAEIRANAPVSTRLMTPDDAVAAGALALFGEKYGDEVRVLSMGRNPGDRHYSVELCGGTHVNATGDIGLLKIIGESAVSSGVRRIEALTGEGALAWLTQRDQRLKEAAATLKASPDEVPARVASLADTVRKLERELADAKKALAMGGGTASASAGPEDVAGIAFLGRVVEGLDPKELRSTVDQMKAEVKSGVAALVAVNDGRASVAVGVTEGIAASAVDLVKAAVAALGGQGGGGRPDMAQGGGPDGAKAEDALAAVKDALEKVAA